MTPIEANQLLGAVFARITPNNHGTSMVVRLLGYDGPDAYWWETIELTDQLKHTIRLLDTPHWETILKAYKAAEIDVLSYVSIETFIERLRQQNELEDSSDIHQGVRFLETKQPHVCKQEEAA